MLYMDSSNELQRNRTGLHLFIAITRSERTEARKIAKSAGMTLQGWLAQLIKKEIANYKKENTKEVDTY